MILYIFLIYNYSDTIASEKVNWLDKIHRVKLAGIKIELPLSCHLSETSSSWGEDKQRTLAERRCGQSQ